MVPATAAAATPHACRAFALHWLWNEQRDDSRTRSAQSGAIGWCASEAMPTWARSAYVDAHPEPHSRPLKCFYSPSPNTDTSVRSPRSSSGSSATWATRRSASRDSFRAIAGCRAPSCCIVSVAPTARATGSRAPLRRRPGRARAPAQAGLDLRWGQGICLPCALTDAPLAFRTVLMLALPALAAIVVYLPTLSGGFLSDDYSLLHFFYGADAREVAGARRQDLRLRRRSAVEPVPPADDGVVRANLCSMAAIRRRGGSSTSAACRQCRAGRAALVAARGAVDARRARPRRSRRASRSRGSRPVAEAVAWVAARFDGMALFWMLVAACAFMASRAWWDRYGLASLAATVARVHEQGIGCDRSRADRGARMGAAARRTRASCGGIARALVAALPWIAIGAAYFAYRTWIFGDPFRFYPGTSPGSALLSGHWLAALPASADWWPLVMPETGPRRVYAFAALFSPSPRYPRRFTTDARTRARGHRARCARCARIAVLALGLVGNGRRRARPVPDRGDRRAGGRAAAALAQGRLGLASWIVAAVLLGSGLLLTRASVERRASAGAEMNALIAALAATADAMPADSYAFVIVPDRIGAIPFARNAQGGLMLPPVQPRSLSSKLVVQLPQDLPTWPAMLAKNIIGRLKCERAGERDRRIRRLRAWRPRPRCPTTLTAGACAAHCARRPAACLRGRTFAIGMTSGRARSTTRGAARDRAERPCAPPPRRCAPSSTPRSRACRTAAGTSSVPRSRRSSASSPRTAARASASRSATAPTRSSSRCARSGSGRATRSRPSPNAGMYATTAIRAAGATPAYVEIDASTLLIDPAALRAASRRRARAVIVTHLYGRLADVDALAAVAHERGIALIEDCAQAHGAQGRGGKAGTFGALGCFSFYPTKNLGALGDAGAVVTDDPRARGETARAANLRLGRQVPLHDGRRDELADGRVAGGRAAREAAASRRLESPAARRSPRAMPGAIRASRHRAAVRRRDGSDVAHLYVVRTTERESLRAHLEAAGVATDIHYPAAGPPAAGRRAMPPQGLARTERRLRRGPEPAVLP